MNLDELKTKLKFYFEHKISIHVDTIENKFYNGLILEFSESLIVILDRVLGEIPVPLTEIRNLERYKGGWGDDTKTITTS